MSGRKDQRTKPSSRVDLHLPSGFVTRAEMEDRKQNRKLRDGTSDKLNGSNTLHTKTHETKQYKLSLPQGFVSYADMKVRTKNKKRDTGVSEDHVRYAHSYDFQHHPFDSNNSNYNTHPSPSCHMEMEHRMECKKCVERSPEGQRGGVLECDAAIDLKVADIESHSGFKEGDNKRDYKKNPSPKQKFKSMNDPINIRRDPAPGTERDYKKNPSPKHKSKSINVCGDPAPGTDTLNPVISPVVKHRELSGMCVPSRTSNPSAKVTSQHTVQIMIMNANGPYDQKGEVPMRRRLVIQSIVRRVRPTLVLFQEFKWVDIRGKTWRDSPLPEEYVYSGHHEASIMFNADQLIDRDVQTDIRRVLEGLQRSAYNQLHTTFPLDFDPLPRMTSKLITVTKDPHSGFLCISWHGLYRNKKVFQRVEYFKYLMEFLRNIYNKLKQPLLIGGDFNVNMSDIAHLIKLPFLLCEYKASDRRTKWGIIDYFITTEDLKLTNVAPIDFDLEEKGHNPTGIFDHDPIQATLILKWS